MRLKLLAAAVAAASLFVMPVSVVGQNVGGGERAVPTTPAPIKDLLYVRIPGARRRPKRRPTINPIVSNMRASREDTCDVTEPACWL